MTANNTSIEWTDRSWNPIRGCSRISPGCQRCYAEQIAARFSGEGQPYEGLATRSPARWTSKVQFIEKDLDAPLRWRKPQRVFVNSMSDLFHESVPDEWIDKIFAVMAFASQHTFQVLTKRPERMLQYMQRLSKSITPLETVARSLGRTFFYEGFSLLVWPIRNIHLGVSVEDQKTADERAGALLLCPAVVHWLSCEPLLAEIDLTHCTPARDESPDHLNALTGMFHSSYPPIDAGAKIDWVVVGGESGPGARPVDISWIRSIVGQCRVAGVPCFVKQLGSKPVWDGCGLMANNPRCLTSQAMDGSGLLQLHPNDRKGGDMSEWPEDLRIREFPASLALNK